MVDVRWARRRCQIWGGGGSWEMSDRGGEGGGGGGGQMGDVRG